MAAFLKMSRALLRALALVVATAAGAQLSVAAEQTAAQPNVGAAPAEHYFVKAGLLIDPDSSATIKNGVIEVSGGKILRIGKAGDVAVPADAKVLDYSGKFIVPGLIDVHGHLYTTLTFGHTSNDVIPRLYLPAGVTAVLSPGSGNPEGDFALKHLIDTDRVAGPRLFLAGEYLEMAPAQAPWMQTVATENEVKARIDHWASRGATAVKLYAGMKGDIMRAAVAHAHWLGLKVHGHLGETTWTDAIDMGVDVLHHGIYGFPEIVPEGMPPLALGAVVFAPPQLGFDKWYEQLAQTDLSQPKVRRVLQKAAAAKVIFVPTAVALETYDHERDHMAEQQQFYSPEAWKKVTGRLEMPKNPYGAILMKKNLEFIRLASEAGCLLALGTDLTTLQLLPGFSLWREMELFSEAGLSPMAVLKAATINGAHALGRSDSIGSLTAGKHADLVVLDANPLENISNVRRVHRVVKGGVVYDPAELLKPLQGRVH